MKKIILPLFLLIVCVAAFGQEPAGYYSAAENKSDAALKTSLSIIISANYVDKGYDYLYTIYQTSDNLPNGKVWDMYSLKADGTANYYFTHSSDKCGAYNNEGDCYNREHTFCDSWLGKVSPQRSDAHHLIPTDGYVNNIRGDNPHGKVGMATRTFSNGSKFGNSDPTTGYSGLVYEPIDEFKGDFARMYFYVATRYESKIAGWVNNGSANTILDGTSYPAYKSWFYNLMLQWCRMDPVSQKEMDRNNAIYTYQKNRNPFIDHPELAEYIWGNKVGTNWTLNTSTDPYLSSPVSGSTIDFGTVGINQSATKTIIISGSNLTGDLTLTLGGANATYFTASASSITKAQAQAGYTITLSHNPLSVGAQNATLTISGGGIQDVTVNLTSNAVSCFNLNFTAPFASTMDPFTQYSVTGDQIWAWKNAAYGVIISGYVSGKYYVNEDWLISPSMDLSNFTNIQLSFDHTSNKGNLANLTNENTLWISNDYSSNPSYATWTQLEIPNYPTGTDWTFVSSGKINIPQINAQKNTVFGFKYVSTLSSSFQWEIKNVLLTGTCSPASGVSQNTWIKKHNLLLKGKNITVTNLDNEDVSVYDIYGRRLHFRPACTGEVTFTLPNAGLYVLKAGNENLKTLIR